ncbi:MAG: ATP synthase F1 subunit epsilon [Patescibacteria group bacterium]|nr:ATP synthase F1 subunit epsilon [Patescibacteria group bacterium]
MIHFELITPERVVYRQEADQVTLPTANGEITVLPGHASLVAALVPGIARLKLRGVEEEVAVSGGFIEVGGDKVRVLADTAERGEELEISVIEEAKKRAEKVMQEAARQDDVSFAAAMAAMEREMARYKLAKRRRTPKQTPTIDSAVLPSDENPV